jgi:hypothetical protein
MNIKNITLILLVLITNLAPSFAMDIEPQNRATQSSLFETLPMDVLGRILHFVSLENPRALNDLATIQQVCKSLTGILSHKQIQFILALDQNMLAAELSTQLRAVNVPNPRETDLKKIKFLINLGAQMAPLAAYSVRSITRYPHGNPLILLLFNSATAERAHDLLFAFIDGSSFNQDNTIEFLFNNNREKTAQVLIEIDSTVTDIRGGAKTSLLAHAKSAKIAKILLDSGCRLFIDCDNKTQTFKKIIGNAARANDPGILIAVLKHHYALETATAIALALMAGASIASAMCAIL